jgi:hypothetical protein
MVAQIRSITAKPAAPLGATALLYRHLMKWTTVAATV